MKNTLVITLLICIMGILSCSRRTKCKITPIKSNVIDINKLKGDFIFKDNEGKIDTLTLIDYYNIFNNITIKSLTTYEECEHSIGFDYDSNNKKGTISLGLNKNENNEYQLLINGFCISEDIKMNESSATKDSLIIIHIRNCDKTDYKTIAFKKYKIEYFETKDGNIWKPIKFIPR